MRISPPAEAPDLTLDTWDGSTVRLADHRGRKVWLAFFRYASCPLCNLRVHQMIERHAGYAESGLDVLGVFQSPPGSMRRYVATQAPPFPLLCDPEERVYARYGCESSLAGYVAPTNGPVLARAMSQGFLPGRMEGTKTRLPADFLIDEEGVVQEAFYASAIADHIPFERVDAFLS